MFDTGSQPTLMKSVVELGDSRLELADSSSNFNADPAKDGVWVQALKETKTHPNGHMCQKFAN